MGYVDDPEGFHKGCRHRVDPHGYCEGSVLQTDDEVIHMMLRIADREVGGLAVAESRDDGVTWSEPAVTGSTDACSLFQFGCLPERPLLRPVVPATAQPPRPAGPGHQR